MFGFVEWWAIINGVHQYCQLLRRIKSRWLSHKIRAILTRTFQIQNGQNYSPNSSTDLFSGRLPRLCTFGTRWKWTAFCLPQWAMNYVHTEKVIGIPIPSPNSLNHTEASVTHSVNKHPSPTRHCPFWSDALTQHRDWNRAVEYKNNCTVRLQLTRGLK